jgi:hypothetical protein
MNVSALPVCMETTAFRIESTAIYVSAARDTRGFIVNEASFEKIEFKVTGQKEMFTRY